MPNRLTKVLGATCALLALLYFGLIGTTVFYATVRTEYVSENTTLEASVGTLETEYFSALAHVQSSDPHALGFATPVAEHFVSSALPTLTLTDVRK